MEIPIYLKDYTEVQKNKKHIITLRVVCKCGCDSFYLLKNRLEVAKTNIIEAQEKKFTKWRNIENYIDPITKIRYLVTKNVFGKIYDMIPISRLDNINEINIIKVKCSKCENEKIIFDNRHNGYNSMVTDKRFFHMDKEYFYDLIQKETMGVEIKLQNDLTYEEYCEEVGKEFADEYQNAFSSITIYGIINKTKKIFFEEETA